MSAGQIAAIVIAATLVGGLALLIFDSALYYERQRKRREREGQQ